jgi:hypothetical protein
MSFYSYEYPKTVDSVNGKYNAISIEAANDSIVVDNKTPGKIKLSAKASAGGEIDSDKYVERAATFIDNDNDKSLVTEFSNPGKGYEIRMTSFIADENTNTESTVQCAEGVRLHGYLYEKDSEGVSNRTKEVSLTVLPPSQSSEGKILIEGETEIKTEYSGRNSAGAYNTISKFGLVDEELKLQQNKIVTPYDGSGDREYVSSISINGSAINLGADEVHMRGNTDIQAVDGIEFTVPCNDSSGSTNAVVRLEQTDNTSSTLTLVANYIVFSNGNAGTIQMPHLTIGTDLSVGAGITVGNTTLSEAQVQALLALLPPPP